MHSASPRLRSFLLRCWQEQPDGTANAKTMPWRFSLREITETPQEQGFSSPEQLITFLLARLNEDEKTG